MHSRTIDRIRFPEPLSWRAALLTWFVVNVGLWAVAVTLWETFQ